MRKYARIVVAAVSVLALSLCLFGCGGSDSKSSGGEQQKETVEQGAQADADNPDAVKIGKASMASDYEGKKRLVVEFEWTNNGDETSEFFTEYNITPYQDGEEIERTFGDGDGWFNDQKSIKPGKTQTFKAMFETKGSKDVEIEVSELWGDTVASKTFELK